MRASTLSLVLVSLAVAACGASSPAPTGTTAPAVATAPAGKPAPASRGRVETRTFASEALGVDKDYIAYLPAGYDERGQRYPVIFVLHGIGGDEANWTRYVKLPDLADRVGLQAILVMVDGDAGWYVNNVRAVDWDECQKGRATFNRQKPAHFCVRTPAYEDYMVRDLVGEVDGRYRTLASRAGRGIVGFSMGGYGALVLAMRHPEVYAGAASHAGVAALLYAGPYPYDAAKVQLVEDVSTWGDGAGSIGAWARLAFGTQRANWQAHDPATLARGLENGQLALYLDVGDDDMFGLDAGNRYLHDILSAASIEHAFAVVPGGRHDFAFLRDRMDDSLGFLVGALAPAQ